MIQRGRFMTVHERLRDFRKSKGLTMQAFAESIGINNPRTYQPYEIKRPIPMPVLERIAEVHGISLDYLLIGRGGIFPDGTIPGEVAKIPTVDLIDGVEVLSGHVFIESMRINHPTISEVRAFQVSGNSMVPTLSDGDMVLFVPGLIRDNDIYIVDSGGYRVRRAAFHPEAFASVSCDAPGYPPDYIPRNKVVGLIVNMFVKNGGAFRPKL